MKTIFPQRLKAKNKSDLPKPIIKAILVEPYDDDETILQTIEDCADRIMMALEVNDCDEKVRIEVSRNTGIFDLQINGTTYHLAHGEWEILKG